MKIDGTTGRLLEFGTRGESTAKVTVRTEKGALDAETANLERSLAASVEEYDPSSPWKSVLEFFVDESLHMATWEGSNEAARNRYASVSSSIVWSPPGLDDLWDFTQAPAQPDDPFWIPSHRAGFSYAGLFKPHSASRKNLAGLLLPIYRRMVPKTGWLWPAGRDAALYWAAEDDKPGFGFDDIFLATLDWRLRACLDKNAEGTGLQSADVRAIARACEPFLSEDSWLGRWFLSLAASARELDESKLNALARLIPENAPREAVVQSLLLLKSDPAERIDQVLRFALDQLWTGVLRSGVEESLGESSVPPDEGAIQPEPNDQILPASIKDALKALRATEGPTVPKRQSSRENRTPIEKRNSNRPPGSKRNVPEMPNRDRCLCRALNRTPSKRSPNWCRRSRPEPIRSVIACRRGITLIISMWASSNLRKSA